jgi:hypothetical protein
MIHQILPFLIALPLPMIWIIFVVPLLFRFVGISLPLNPRKRTALNLEPEQNMFVGGCLYWAVPIFIFSLVDIYSRWKLYGASSDRLTAGRIADEFFISVLGGVIAGLAFAYQQEKRSHPNQP